MEPQMLGHATRPRRAVLWDLDGTLLDSRQSIRETMNRVLAERGLPGFSAAELAGLIGQPLRDILSRRSADAHVVAAMAQRYRVVYGESGWVTVQLFPGLEELVARLRRSGLVQGVITSKGQAEADLLLRDLGVAHLFDVVVGDDDRRPLKPDPAPVLHACALLGLGAEQAVLVGDHVNDVQAARSAGLACIAVLWGMGEAKTLRDAGANALARDAQDLATVLATWRRDRP